MKYKLEATIPTTQYGNIRPTFEFDSASEMVDAQTQMERLWATYGEKELHKKEGEFVRVETFTGETVLYDAIAHIYKNLDGEVLESASQFKKKQEKPFNVDFVAGKTAEKYGVPIEDVKDVWSNNGNISRTFGNAIHYAMEQFWKHKKTACGDKQYNLPKHKVLRDAVESFPIQEGNIVAEPMVSNVEKKMVGQIDAIEITGDFECNLWDYKTDAELTPAKAKGHFIQLSFYADILQAFGWKVNKIVVWNYTGEDWVPYESEPLDITIK